MRQSSTLGTVAWTILAVLSAGCAGSAHAPGNHTTTSSGSTTGVGGAPGAGGAATGEGGTGGSGATSSSTASGSSSTTSSGAGAGGPTGPVPVPKTFGKKIYAHMLPWFETPASSSNGMWGTHWTMANQNPNVISSNGQRQIASYYYPMIGPYASSDHDVIEYQLLLMKYAGLDGVLIDWPGTIQAYDYPKNLNNCEAIMALTAAVGLDFAVVYEDANVGAASAAHFISNEIAAGQADVTYAQNTYFGQSNYIHVNGPPLLLDFGPQTFTTQSDWDQVLAPLSTKPTLITLWYESSMAGSDASGEFAWLYQDFLTGLTNFYQNHPVNVRFGVGYPGFNPFYAAGGWAGPTYTLPYNGTGTFVQTLGMAASSDAGYVQLATWNDYGEGTMIEPTVQFGYGFLTTLQQNLGVTYGQNELDLINTLYNQRKQYAGNSAMQAMLDQAFNDLVSLQVSAAASVL